MKKLLLLIVLLGLIPNPGYCGENILAIPVNTILHPGEEIRVAIPADIKRISISLRNLLDEESVIFRSERFEKKERPENEIGPRQYRTTTLAPKVEDETAARLLDRKKIVINTDKTDEIYFKLEKGSIEIQITEEKKKI